MKNEHGKFLLLCFLLAFTNSIFSQRKALPKIEIVNTDIKTSLRGLSVVNNNVVWVSGSNGIVGKTSNGGKNWKWMTVKGFEKYDFRDIEAFDANIAIIMSIADPAYILKTTDGGETWKVVYENKTKGMFLDAMEFRDPANGVVIGDPVDGRFFIAKTSDGGKTWNELPAEERPVADSSEAFFASSGTNIRYLSNKSIVMASGGKNSRLFYDKSVYDLPMTKGKESAGTNSVAVYDNYKKSKANKLVVVGGDFTADSIIDKNCFVSNNGGKTWERPKTPPGGYRSCVEFLDKETIVTCGLNGVDYSYDGGKNFYSISKEGFHACRYARFGNTVYLTGGNGKIGKLVWPD
ncbi:MAG TPA: YCF48-related protein [Chitinophagaceae bacterium]|nr:YCF48-related protein [Chitinophagaceae bacterium]